MVDAELSQDEILFMNDPLSYFGKDPVTFPVSDGSTVTVSAHADYVLRETFGIERVKAVKANGKRYLYTPFEIPDMDVIANYFGKAGRPRRWLFAEFLARHIYHLHHHLPGDGRIMHSGADSFLPSDFTREQVAEHHFESDETAKAAKTYVPKVGPETIELQLSWLDESLLLKARKKAAKKVNSAIAHDIVNDVLCEIVARVQNGQVRETKGTEEKPSKDLTVKNNFQDWILGAVTYRSCEVATAGSVNRDVLPDKLELQLKKSGVVRRDMPDEYFNHLSEMRSYERSVEKHAVR